MDNKTVPPTIKQLEEFYALVEILDIEEVNALLKVEMTKGELLIDWFMETGERMEELLTDTVKAYTQRTLGK